MIGGRFRRTPGSLLKPETDAEDAVVVGGGNDPESPDRARALHVLTTARAGVVVADPDDPDSLPGLFRQAREVERASGLRARQVFFPDGKVGRNHLVHAAFDLFPLPERQVAVEVIITLGFFLLDMSAERTSPVEHTHHRLVEYVLGGVHPRIVLFGHCRIPAR